MFKKFPVDGPRPVYSKSFLITISYTEFNIECVNKVIILQELISRLKHVNTDDFLQRSEPSWNALYQSIHELYFAGKSAIFRYVMFPIQDVFLLILQDYRPRRSRRYKLYTYVV